jgi:hypothetical protein
MEVCLDALGTVNMKTWMGPGSSTKLGDPVYPGTQASGATSHPPIWATMGCSTSHSSCRSPDQ